VKLAEALEKGQGAKRDVARASTLYQTACDAGSGVACNNLGALYATGDGVPKDTLRAVGLYRRGCDQATAMSCTKPPL
jgi:TPR repeat protein